MNNNLVRVVGTGRPCILDTNLEALVNSGAQRIDGGTVQRIKRTLALERRWTIVEKGPRGTEHHGFFHAGGKRFQGKATVSNSSIDVFVRGVPPGLRLHKERHCFHLRSDGWYWVHHNRHASLDAAILEIEAILTECLHLTSEIPPKGIPQRSAPLPSLLAALAKLFGH